MPVARDRGPGVAPVVYNRCDARCERGASGSLTIASRPISLTRSPERRLLRGDPAGSKFPLADQRPIPSCVVGNSLGHPHVAGSADRHPWTRANQRAPEATHLVLMVRLLARPNSGQHFIQVQDRVRDHRQAASSVRQLCRDDSPTFNSFAAAARLREAILLAVKPPEYRKPAGFGRRDVASERERDPRLRRVAFLHPLRQLAGV